MPDVTQADREAAEPFRQGKGGRYDRDVERLAAAFARHRSNDAAPMPNPTQADREAPKRIYLLDYGSAECTWCEDNSPSGEDHSPVEYVRADTARIAALEAENARLLARVVMLSEALDLANARSVEVFEAVQRIGAATTALGEQT